MHFLPEQLNAFPLQPGAEHQEEKKLKLAHLQKLITQQRLETTFSSRDSWFKILLIHADLQ
jgi:hypothetical protein